MCQKSYTGLSYMDMAKASIENFLKTRPVESDGKNYREKVQIFTTEFSLPDRAFSLLSSPNDSIVELSRKLKFVKPHGARDLKRTVLEVFTFIDLYRLSTGIDTISMGRFPFFNEPTIIILISCDLIDDCANPVFGSDSDKCSFMSKYFLDIAEQPTFYHQPFRWDQRFYVVDIAPVGILCRENQIINYRNENAMLNENYFFNLAMETNGQWVPVYNETTLSNVGFTLKAPCNQQETLIPVWFVRLSSCGLLGAKLGPNLSRFNAISTLDYFREEFSLDDEKQGIKAELVVPAGSMNTKFYPIPEEFYPPTLNPQDPIPRRDSIPVIVVSETAILRPVCNELPTDKYRLDTIQFPDYIIDSVDNSMNCLPCFILNSGNNVNNIGESFGYIAFDKTEGFIFLYILPYNYSILIPLVNEWVSTRGRVSKIWREKFFAYFHSVPYYCIHSIRNTLKKVGISVTQYVPDINEIQYNRRIDLLLRNGKPMAKRFYDSMNVNSSTASYSELISNYDVIMNYDKVDFDIPPVKLEEQSDFRSLLFKQSMPKFSKIYMGKFLFPPVDMVQLSLDHYGGRPDKNDTLNPFTNPFNIQRDQLLTMLPKLYENLCKSSLHKVKPQYEDKYHSVCIEMMGSYHGNDANNLRPIDPTLIRTNSFGNPFKTRQMEYDVKVDETTDQPDSPIPDKYRESSQARKQREYKSRRRRFLVQRVGRIRRSLSQSYLDSLDNVDSNNTSSSKSDLSPISVSSVEFGTEDEEDNDVQIIEDSYMYGFESVDGETSSVYSTQKISQSRVGCGKTFFTTIKKFIHLIRMHIINTKLIEKLVKENCKSSNVKRFVSCLKAESLKYRRWDTIKPIVERYIDKKSYV